MSPPGRLTQLLAVADAVYTAVYMVRPAGMPFGIMPPPPPPPMPPPPPAAALGLRVSTMTACVVSMMPAMPHALVSPLRVTCGGQQTTSVSQHMHRQAR